MSGVIGPPVAFSIFSELNGCGQNSKKAFKNHNQSSLKKKELYGIILSLYCKFSICIVKTVICILYFPFVLYNFLIALYNFLFVIYIFHLYSMIFICIVSEGLILLVCYEGFHWFNVIIFLAPWCQETVLIGPILGWVLEGTPPSPGIRAHLGCTPSSFGARRPG